MTGTYCEIYEQITHGQPVTDMTPAELAAAERLARAALDAQAATLTGGCITGEPCRLGCGLFCALEPTDTAPSMGGACVACGASSWTCFSSGPCCAGCDH